MSYTDLNFDDINLPNGQGQIPQGYGGLYWQGVEDFVCKPSEAETAYPDSGFFTGITSGDQVAFSDHHGSFSIDARSFDFKSINITAALDTSLEVSVQAIGQNGQVVFHRKIEVTDSTPFHYVNHVKGIQHLSFYGMHGVHDSRFDHHSQTLVFDDLKVSNVIPSDDPRSQTQTSHAAFAGHIPVGEHLAAHGPFAAGMHPLA